MARFLLCKLKGLCYRDNCLSHLPTSLGFYLNLVIPAPPPFIWWLLLHLQSMWFSGSVYQWLGAAQHTAWNNALLQGPYQLHRHPCRCPATLGLGLWSYFFSHLTSSYHLAFLLSGPSVCPLDKSPASILRTQVRSYHFPVNTFQWFPSSLRVKSRLLHWSWKSLTDPIPIHISNSIVPAPPSRISLASVLFLCLQTPSPCLPCDLCIDCSLYTESFALHFKCCLLNHSCSSMEFPCSILRKVSSGFYQMLP